MAGTLSEVEKLLGGLSRGEKAQLLKWVVQDLGDDFAGIDSRPGVCGGEPSIVRTRIPVWLLEQARLLKTCTVGAPWVRISNRREITTT
jgi:uncharacterized protein DUF433